jgi:hypothetical protein
MAMEISMSPLSWIGEVDPSPSSAHERDSTVMRDVHWHGEKHGNTGVRHLAK